MERLRPGAIGDLHTIAKQRCVNLGKNSTLTGMRLGFTAKYVRHPQLEDNCRAMSAANSDVHRTSTHVKLPMTATHGEDSLPSVPLQHLVVCSVRAPRSTKSGSRTGGLLNHISEAGSSERQHTSLHPDLERGALGLSTLPCTIHDNRGPSQAFSSPQKLRSYSPG